VYLALHPFVVVYVGYESPGYDVKLCPAVPPLLAALGGLAAGRASGCKKLARHPP